jgi:sugar (pentulose or hexulose) kinase
MKARMPANVRPSNVRPSNVRPLNVGPSNVWLGLDLGTQSVRALAVTDDGERLAAASRPLHSHRDGPRHEQNPESWWSACVAVLREVTAGLGGRPIAGLAACATSGTVLLTGAGGTPLTPGLMYDDARATEIPGLLERLRDAGHTPQASWAVAKLAWLRATGNWPADARVTHQGDLINRRLTGHDVATDSAQALKSGVDLGTLTWPHAYFEAIGLDPSAFPAVVLPGTLLGTVSAGAAEETGVPPGTPVLAGTTDGCAAQFAAGALTPGDWNSVLGTTLVVKGVSTAPVHEPTGAVYNHRAPAGDLWLPGGASSTGAGTIAALFDPDDLRAPSLPAWEDVPAAYPLIGTGERFPFVAPDATGLVGALPIKDAVSALGRGPALAAVLLGVACLERLCYDLLAMAGAPPLTALSTTGGATRNDTWNQLRCDVLGVPVRLPAYPEPALGSALVAASSTGDLATLAGRMVSVRAELRPGPGRTGAYHRFLDLLEHHGWIGEPLAAYARNRSAA